MGVHHHKWLFIHLLEKNTAPSIYKVEHITNQAIFSANKELLVGLVQDLNYSKCQAELSY